MRLPFQLRKAAEARLNMSDVPLSPIRAATNAAARDF